MREANRAKIAGHGGGLVKPPPQRSGVSATLDSDDEMAAQQQQTSDVDLDSRDLPLEGDEDDHASSPPAPVAKSRPRPKKRARPTLTEMRDGSDGEHDMTSSVRGLSSSPVRANGLDLHDDQSDNGLRSTAGRKKRLMEFSDDE